MLYRSFAVYNTLEGLRYFHNSPSQIRNSMKIKVSLILILLLLTAPIYAIAGSQDEYAQRIAREAERNTWYSNREAALAAAKHLRDTCVRAAVPMSEVRVCSDRYADDIESILKETYEASLRVDANASPNLKHAMVVAQKAWLQYRDAECKVAKVLYNGGNGTGIAVQSCRAKLAIMRVRYLASSQEDD